LSERTSERIVVVIPALNAEGTLLPVVVSCLEELRDVIVIDDGSSDRTGDVARSAGVTVLRHERNQGKGGALKSGFAEALRLGFDAVITLDADGQHLPSEIPKFLRAREESGAELIIGSRDHLFEGMLPRRRNANRFSAWAISKCAGVRIGDSQSGFRLYAASLLREVPIHSNGFNAESEVIVRAGRRGRKIISIPIDLGFVNGISTSHYRPLADTLRIAATVTRTRLFG
jgi:glycosyltransferase involved in cell wall biosynthesis